MRKNESESSGSAHSGGNHEKETMSNMQPELRAEDGVEPQEPNGGRETAGEGCKLRM
jgi:hypothetical protein